MSAVAPPHTTARLPRSERLWPFRASGREGGVQVVEAGTREEVRSKPESPAPPVTRIAEPEMIRLGQML